MNNGAEFGANLKLDQILGRISDGVLLFDDRSICLYINDAAVHLIGKSAKDWVGLKFADIFPFLQDKWFESGRFATSENEDISYYWHTKKWMQVRMYSSTGGFSIYIRDLTPTVRMQSFGGTPEALTRNQENKAICLLDVEGMILDANALAVKSLGCLDAAQLRHTVFSTWVKSIGDNTLSYYYAFILHGKTQSLRVNLRLDLTRVFNLTLFPVQIAGQVFGMYAVITPWPDTKNRALHPLGLVLSQALRIAHIVTWEWDIDKDIVYWARDVSQLEHPRVLGTLSTFLNRVHPDDRPRLKLAVERTLRTNQVCDVEYRIMTESEQMYHARAELLCDSDGKPQRLIGISQNINQMVSSQNVLRQVEEKYRLIEENAQDIITVSEPDGDIRYISPSVTRQLGHPQSEVVGAKFDVLLHPQESERVHQTFQHIQEGKDTATVIYRLRHQSGYYLWYETVMKAVRDESGRALYLISVARNITERKQAEDSLRKVNGLLTSIFNFSPVAIGIFDLEGNAMRINTAFEQMFGWEQSELQGPFPVTPKELQASKKQRFELIAGGVIPFDSSEGVCLTKMGTSIHVHETLSPIRNEAGEVVAISEIGIDITGQKSTESRLRKSEHRFEIAQKIANLGSYEWRFPGQEMACSTEMRRIMGLLEEAGGCQMTAFMQRIHPDDRARVQAVLSSAQEGKSSDIEFRIVRADEGVRSIYSQVEVFGDVGGDSLTIIGTVQDVTEEKHTEDTMREYAKLSAVGELAAGVAHEIRNPLTSLSGFLHLLSDKITDESSWKYMKIMKDELHRIDAIISELLSLAKPQTFQFADCDLVTELNDVVALLETQAIIQNVQIFTSFPPGPVIIRCERHQLKQVFVNIIKNAIEASEPGEHIEIEIAFDSRELRVIIADSGIGIARDDLDRIGQPFFTTKPTGIGLGFAVSQRIVADHHGSIEIDSRKDVGTKVVIRIPINPCRS